MEAAGQLVFVVRDTGAGISRENLKHLFEEGIQFHANLLQAGGGSGLGLWISKGIIEMHGGSLSGHSDGAGRGSVFTFRIPAYLNETHNYISSNLSMVQQYQQLHHRARDRDHVSSQPPGTRSRTTSTATVEVTDEVQHLSSLLRDLHISTVLVVDDAPSSRKIVCRLLRMAGCKYTEATNGQESLDKFQEAVSSSAPLGLILMDFEMPMSVLLCPLSFRLSLFLTLTCLRMNGPEAVKRLRELGCRAPIFGLTGNVLPEDVQLFVSNGADAVLGKPLTITRLTDCLESLPTTHCSSSNSASPPPSSSSPPSL
jgi:CheY-like chemotaxis protein